jgi:hypothetical protein
LFFKLLLQQALHRAACVTEEVLLLREKMRRIIEFLKWKSGWWVSRAAYPSEDKGLVEGLRAYAYKQASLQNGLSQHFWKTPLEELSVNGTLSGDEPGGGPGQTYCRGLCAALCIGRGWY